MTTANAYDFSLRTLPDAAAVAAANGRNVPQLLPPAHYDAVLQALPAAVILLDQRGVVYQANPAAMSLLGEPLTGQRWLDVIGRCFRPRSDDGLEVSLQDGRRVKLQISTLAQTGASSQAGQLIMLTDLTETRQLQSRLSHMQRLSTLGKMMATLAHQIRTPLSAALLYTQNLANPRATLQVQQQFQQKLLSRLQDLDQQVSDMLLFARSGSARQVAAFSLKALIEQLNTSIEALLHQHNTRLSLHCSDPALCLLGNQNALCGALQNLIQNSIQAAGPDTQIRLDIMPSAHHHDMLLLRLTDNGPGVAPALRDSLFEPFVTGRAQGTGLGLAVVQAVVHSHQGSVQYIPTERGACFEMLLPIQQSVNRE
ncbi:two-component system sensor histidine kinase FlrB [Rheinheimera pacifica]|uniref:sensor histidine kinase n=1 Tax=Rheinheimera pacifica TaxID=173990 RepID=UPI00286308EC|nr:ATP-binding protein [Rheinheimera pacifica]MDR6983940.1 two-component system sensor histidine kinase FlrB [Rheinheimera pacifica]